MPTLQEIRSERGLGIRALARLASVSPNTIMNIEKGIGVYSATVKRIAYSLGISPEDITGVVIVPSGRWKKGRNAT